MSHDEPRLQLHAYLKSLSGYRGAPLHVDLCFYVCNPKNSQKVSTTIYNSQKVSTTPKSLRLLLKFLRKYTSASRKRVTHTEQLKLRDKQRNQTNTFELVALFWHEIHVSLSKIPKIP